MSVADELEYVKKYLRLEQARFGERLQVRWELDPGVLDTELPVLSVQPLVENAVRHGLERRGGRGTVEIRAREAGADVELQVIDDGMGMNPARARAVLEGRLPAQGGIGLSNVQARLQATYGPEYGLRIQSQVGRGTTATITLPRRTAEVRAA